MINEDMQQQNNYVSQRQTYSAEIQADKVPAPRKFKKCLRRTGQWLCVLLAACFAFCCLVLYQNRGHNPYCGSTCTRAEVDANKIISDIADYFSIPAHTSLGPTPIFIGPQAGMKNGIQFSALHDKNTGKITGNINKITISVVDVAGLCQKSYQEANFGWNNGVFTKTIEPLPNLRYYDERRHATAE